MTHKVSIVAVVLARGGSKGVPGKNIRIVGGKPLISWTIDEALKSAFISRVFVSTDDAEIVKVSLAAGAEVPFVRPKNLALDDTPSAAAVAHALDQLEGDYDYVVLLQPTSPLRTVEDIDGCIRRCISNSAPAAVSVCTTSESPFWMYTVDCSSGRLVPVIKTSELHTRRQDLPSTHVINGAVYVARVDWFCRTKTFVTEETLGYVMPRSRSLDIDTEDDFKILAKYFEEEHDEYGRA